MKNLIAITGGDGTGKSTLIGNLVKGNSDMLEVTNWDPMKNGLFQSKSDVDNYLCSLSANARTLFLAHALTEALEKAMEMDQSILLLNAYYYKYFASELALGAAPNLINTLISNFPVPSLVIQLEADESITVTRKKRYSRYECGCGLANEITFLSFQEKVKPFWSQFNKDGWVSISTELPAHEVYNVARELIDQRIK